MSKLNDIQRQDIINSLADGVSGGILARKYNVNRSTIFFIKRQNLNLITQRRDNTKEIKEQTYYLALTKLKSAIESTDKIPIGTLVNVLRELNQQIKLDEGKATAITENIKHYEKLSASQLEDKIKCLLTEYKHIKTNDVIVDQTNNNDIQEDIDV